MSGEIEEEADADTEADEAGNKSKSKKGKGKKSVAPLKIKITKKRKKKKASSVSIEPRIFKSLCWFVQIVSVVCFLFIEKSELTACINSYRLVTFGLTETFIIISVSGILCF